MKNVELEDIFNTEDDSAIGFILEVDLKHPDAIKEKRKTFFRFDPENKDITQAMFIDYKSKTKSKNYTSCKKLTCVGTDKKNCFVHCKMLNY